MMNVCYARIFPYSTDLREERNSRVREGVILQLESGSLVSYSILPAAPSFMHVTTLASYVVLVVVILGVARIYSSLLHYSKSLITGIFKKNRGGVNFRFTTEHYTY